MRKIILVAGLLVLSFSGLTLSKGLYVPQSIPSSAFVPVIIDYDVKTPPPVTVKPTAQPTPVIKPRKIQAPQIKIGNHSISGLASWYCNATHKSGPYSICTRHHPDVAGVQAYGAAGPALRRALGNYMGRIIYVDGVRVQIIDWCKCTGGSVGPEKLIDLYYDVFLITGSKITIRW